MHTLYNTSRERAMAGFMLDLEGTLVKDKTYTPFEEALRFTELLDSKNIPWIVATNNSTEPPEKLVEILKSKGFNINMQKLITPTVTGINILKFEKIKSIFFLGSESMASFFRENGIEVKKDYRVDAVVVGRDKNINYEKLKLAVSALVINNAKLFSFHTNKIILENDGLVGPSVGAIAQALSFAGGKEITSFGKPSHAYFEIAMNMLGIKNPENVYMVSDDPFSDLAEGKKNVGFITVFVLSGKYPNADIINKLEWALKPDYIFKDISMCKKLVEESNDY